MAYKRILQGIQRKINDVDKSELFGKGHKEFKNGQRNALLWCYELVEKFSSDKEK